MRWIELQQKKCLKLELIFQTPINLLEQCQVVKDKPLAIARAIYFGAKILILDEPTSALGQKQQMEVLKTIKKVQNFGNIAIILITHNEIHARLIADRFTFLSLGEVIGSGLSADLGNEEVKRLMAGGAKIGDLAKELEL
jgi:simple sugar transport system ATP-binding protein